MASSSLIFSPLTLTKTSSSIRHQPGVARFSSSLPFVQSSIKLFCNNNANSSSSSSRFVLKVSAVSSEFDQAEDIFDSGDDEVVERSPPSSSDCKLFVGNLAFNVDSDTLAGLFEQAGNVEMVEVIYDKITGRSRGFGFVTMSSTAEVEAAAQQFNGYELEGRPLRVNYGPPPPKDFSAFRSPRDESGGYGSREGSGYGGRGGSSFDTSNLLYVGNLSWCVDDMALEQLFSEQGNVKEARVAYDRESGRSRGFGFVRYSSADEVNKAIDSLDGTDLDGRPIRVSVAKSKPNRF